MKDLKKSFSCLSKKGKLLLLSPEFESFPRGVVSSCVHVRLPKDYHPDVRVQVYLAGLGAGQPEVDEVSEPLPRIRVAVALFAWHVQCALPQECLVG